MATVLAVKNERDNKVKEAGGNQPRMMDIELPSDSPSQLTTQSFRTVKAPDYPAYGITSADRAISIENSEGTKQLHDRFVELSRQVHRNKGKAPANLRGDTKLVSYQTQLDDKGNKIITVIFSHGKHTVVMNFTQKNESSVAKPSYSGLVLFSGGNLIINKLVEPVALN
jgi:hypothetical protein